MRFYEFNIKFSYKFQFIIFENIFLLKISKFLNEYKKNHYFQVNLCYCILK